MKLDNDARLRQDFTQYRAMLKDLRRSEESFGDGSRIAFLLQVSQKSQGLSVSPSSLILFCLFVFVCCCCLRLCFSLRVVRSFLLTRKNSP